MYITISWLRKYADKPNLDYNVKKTTLILVVFLHSKTYIFTL